MEKVLYESHVALTGTSYETHAEVRGFDLVIDEPEELGGTNKGPGPLEVLLSALGACTSITIKMYAKRKEWDLQSVAVELSYQESSDPEAGNTIKRDIQVKGDLDEKQKERLLLIASKCPVARLLKSDIAIDSRIA